MSLSVSTADLGKAGWMGPPGVYLEKSVENLSTGDKSFRLVKIIQGQGEVQFMYSMICVTQIFFQPLSEIHDGILALVSEWRDGPALAIELMLGNTTTCGPDRSHVISGLGTLAAFVTF